MPDYVVCTRAIKGGSFSSEPGTTRLFTGSKLSNVKRVGVAPRAGRVSRVGLPDNAPAKAVGVDCGAHFLKTQPVPTPSTIPFPTAGISTIPSSSRTSPSLSQETWKGM